MATNYIKTMKDLEASTYGGRSGVGGNSLLKSAGAVAGLHTGHGGAESLGTGTTAASGLSSLYNLVYGKKVWSMLNQEVNALAMLPKRPYTSSGWRIMTDRPEGGSGSTFTVSAANTGASANASGGATPRFDKIGGVAENAKLGTDLVAIAPSYTTLYTSPKTIAHMFEFSELALEMAKIDDGVGDLRALIREDMGKHHAETQNKMLLMPLEHYDVTNDGSDDAAKKVDATANYTSLMKIVSSSAELHDMQAASMFDDSSSTVLIDQLVKLYGNSDRQLSGGAANASFLDSQVDYGAGYASGDARPLTLTILNAMLRSLRENGGSPKVILTGYDTIQHLGDLLQSQERFLDRKEIIPTHGGVRGVKGTEVGFRVATYYDIPLIPCKDMPKTGNGSNKLSDMLILDTDHLWLSVLKPTQYFEDGIDNGNPFGVGTLGNQAMYRTIAETGCSFFKGQGKITNITSA
ncbi:MAG: putative major capsid protein [Prokaryotic dsDNA virus sp.]|nr:MAG: putative major capsid protein [Prokaryotic dsDNA virus sp.]|tara:strand:+ start:13666 stop:15057 length:1392 start_codon:yes stop_codon:yes gene_type:complete